MSWFWPYLAVVYGLYMPTLIVPYAPDSFWQQLEERHPGFVCFLWGYTHPLGPRIRAGETKPWWREETT